MPQLNPNIFLQKETQKDNHSIGGSKQQVKE
jgi:hypothetical protein